MTKEWYNEFTGNWDYLSLIIGVTNQFIGSINKCFWIKIA